MSYLSHARVRRKKGSRLLLGVIVLCLAGYFISKTLVLPLNRAGYFVNNFVYSIMPQGFRKSADIARENEALRQQILQLVAENADRKVLQAENSELKFGLGRAEEVEQVHATILRKPPVSPYDTFVLDVGEDHRVESGDTVVFGNLAIGVVIETGANYSKAKLFSSPGNIFHGTIGKESISIEARGIGGGAFEALVPIGSNITEGDPLILPSISPKVFGFVERTEDLTEEGFKKIFFTLPINPNQINTVNILKG